MQNMIMGRQLRPVTHKRLCHFDGPGHTKIIMPGKVAYQVREGKAQGIFHGPACYTAAKRRYEELERQHFLPKEDNGA